MLNHKNQQNNYGRQLSAPAHGLSVLFFEITKDDVGVHAVNNWTRPRSQSLTH